MVYHPAEVDSETGLFMRSLGVYVAGRVGTEGEMREIYRQIRQMGHVITYAWAEINNIKKPYRDPDNRRHNLPYADAMLAGARDADVCVLIPTEDVWMANREWGAFLGDAEFQSEGRRGYIVGPDTRPSLSDAAEYISFPATIETVYRDLGRISTLAGLSHRPESNLNL